MTLNAKQVLSVTLVILGVLTASAAQLTELVGPAWTKAIVSTSTLVMSMLAGIQGVISSQSSLVRDVQAMPGIDTITVNKRANSTLATLALDQGQAKIEVAKGAEAAVAETAAKAA